MYYFCLSNYFGFIYLFFVAHFGCFGVKSFQAVSNFWSSTTAFRINNGFMRSFRSASELQLEDFSSHPERPDIRRERSGLSADLSLT